MTVFAQAKWKWSDWTTWQYDSSKFVYSIMWSSAHRLSQVQRKRICTCLTLEACQLLMSLLSHASTWRCIVFKCCVFVFFLRLNTYALACNFVTD